MLDYLITGTGNSATGWAAQVLTSAGVPCGHEAVYSIDGVRANDGLRADSSWLAAPHLPCAETTVHLVRDPLPCIRSMAHVFFRGLTIYSYYALAHYGLEPDNNPPPYPGVCHPWAEADALGLAARHYVLWNEMIDGHGPVVRAEDGPEALLAACGLDVPDDVYTNTRYNTRTPPDAPLVKWADIPYNWRRRGQRMAERYGYEVA